MLITRNVSLLSRLVRKKLWKRFFLNTSTMVRYLNQDEAIKIDEELFNEYKFSVDQLMELAGLSCAQAIAKCYPLSELKKKSVLICCGPGNNGGDGLVCARHLSLYGYKTRILYPKRTEKALFANLLHQASQTNVIILNRLPSVEEVQSEYGLVIDAVFGFSFKPPVRPDFEGVMNLLKNTQLPIASIDIPSGWDVNKGQQEEDDIKPELLISLTAPKQCAQLFVGKYHYLGGRFVPHKLEQKYKLHLPDYPGIDCCVSLK